MRKSTINNLKRRREKRKIIAKSKNWKRKKRSRNQLLSFGDNEEASISGRSRHDGYLKNLKTNKVLQIFSLNVMNIISESESHATWNFSLNTKVRV